MIAARRWWRGHLARLPCVLCARGWRGGGRVELHHVAEGSGKRHPDSLAVLCEGHHQGVIGLHGMGTKAFLAFYKPPGLSEYGLVIWTIEDAAKALYAEFGRKKRPGPPLGEPGEVRR